MTDRSSASGQTPSPKAPRSNRGAGLWAGLDWTIQMLVHISLLVSGICIVLILLIGAADTIGRAFWNEPVMGAVEISEALLAVTIFAALAYVQKQGGHVVVDIFSSNYGPRLARVATVLMLALTLAALIFLTWRTGITAEQGWRHNEVSAGFFPVPIWLAKIVAACCLVVACIECLRELIRACLGLHPSGHQVLQDEALEHDLPMSDGI